MKLNKIRKLKKLQTDLLAHKDNKEVAEEHEAAPAEQEDDAPVATAPKLPLALIAARPEIEEGDFEIEIEDEFEAPPLESTNDNPRTQQLPQKQQVSQESQLNGKKGDHGKKTVTTKGQVTEPAESLAEISRPIKTGPTFEQISKKLREIKKVISFTNSIIEPVQTLELKNHMIGKLARVFCMYRVNEIMVYNDEGFARDKRASGFDPSEFIVKILQYLETPQYLRKRLFPISALLRNVGLLTPLECQHHLKIEDVSEYREGVVLKRPTRENDGSWADVGLLRVS
jgi:hypothetical protein